jgi:hypothetical protein
MGIQHSMRRPRGVAAVALVLWTLGSARAAGDPAPPPAPVSVELQEGTEVHLHLVERLSSATSAVGDTFKIVLHDEIRLPDGTILPPGHNGRGEVSIAEKSGMMGRSGRLAIRLKYLTVGEDRIPLRATRSAEGKSGVANAVTAIVLFGLVGVLVRGHNVVYPEELPLVAYVDRDTPLALPLAAPPKVVFIEH